MNGIVTCTGLTKTYQKGVTALDNLTLTIDEGMSFGLMGENDAGKSTLVLLPLIPVGICYNIGVNSSLDSSALPGFLLVALYIAALVWLAGYWLERRELLLH